MKLEKLNIAGWIAALAVGLFAGASPGHAQTSDRSIRPFTVQVPQAALNDLRRRIAATRWPDRETVEDFSQGVQLEKLKPLVQYWGTQYDWRKAEAKLNALPQFVTTIDGVDIHFIHVRSRHPNALPLIITHGWPGSVIEQLKVIAPLTDPTAHGGSAEDAFDVVIPSLPGYGFSSKPTGTGWDPDHIARAWAELMKRLRYTRYVAQGGDWGTPISSAMARQAPAGLLGIHINLPATSAGGTLRQGTRRVRRADRVQQEGELGLLRDDDRAAADSWLRRSGFTGLPRRVDARASRLRAMDVRQRSPTVPDERRRAGQRHAVLADEQRDLVRAAVLGERRARQHP